MPPSDTSLDFRKLTTEELVVGIREGSKEQASACFEELIRRFEPLLRRAWWRVLPSLDYEDYAQDVLLSAFRSIGQLRNPKAFPGYFRRIALTVAVDHVRKNISHDSHDSGRVEFLVDGIDEALFNGLFVRSYLEHLPKRERQVLDLAYLQELSIPEIARELNLSYQAVRSLKSRAINRLREMLLRDADNIDLSK